MTNKRFFPSALKLGKRGMPQQGDFLYKCLDNVTCYALDDNAAHTSDSAPTNDRSSEHNYAKHDTLEVSAASTGSGNKENDCVLSLQSSQKKVKAKEKCLLSQKKYDLINRTSPHSPLKKTAVPK